MPAHRNIQVDLEERVSPEIVRGVREGLASLGVCWDAADLGTLQSRRYRSDHLCIVVPRGHPLAPRKTAAVRGHAGLRTREPAGQQRRAGDAAARMPRSWAARCSTASSSPISKPRCASCAPGLAISLVPREVAGTASQAYGLRIIPLAEPWAERRFIICFRDAAALSPAAQLLVEHLASHHQPP